MQARITWKYDHKIDFKFSSFGENKNSKKKIYVNSFSITEELHFGRPLERCFLKKHCKKYLVTDFANLIEEICDCTSFDDA